ncbi:MAG: hypothetical protein IT165_32035 [Bryobacterales bacterium]|nr:hypothetical protein [Bryobacterales bacterium]
MSGYGLLFADEVYSATDLARKTKEVLSQARKAPVTISRNDEQFAILPRKEAARLFQTVAGLTEVVDLIASVIAIINGTKQTGARAWMNFLEVGDLRALAEEVLTCVREEHWEKVEDVIHEWKESALVMKSGILRDAMAQPSDPAPLTVPEDQLAEPCGNIE